MSTAPIEITVRRYVCPYCHRGHAKPKTAADHIARCWRNPDTRTCRTCQYYEPDKSEPSACHGSPCFCGQAPAECHHNDGPDVSESIQIGCPLWAAPTEGEPDHA